MAKFVMGIDNGGTTTKAALYDLEGKEIAKSSQNTRMITPQPYYTERNVEELFDANITVIREVIKKSGVKPEDIIGIGIAGHGNGLYLMGDHYTAPRNGIVSTDNRATEYLEKWYADGFEEKIKPKTMQDVWAAQPVALLAWLNEHEPQVIDKTNKIFMVKDLIRYYLTGEAYQEITDASGTNMINLHTRDYDDELFEFFGIENWKSKLPPLVESTAYCGKIRKEIAELTGLCEGTPVSGGLFDISSSALSTGLIQENQLGIVTGTWSINEYVTSEPTTDVFLCSIYPLKNRWLATEASPTSGSNLEWYISNFLSDKKAEAKKQGKSIYDFCNQEVEATTPEESNLVFLPFVFGSNAKKNATAGFVGATSYNTPQHFLRAVYEGVVFSHKHHIDNLKVANSALKGPARIAGGITNSKVWLQMFADILQMPLEIVKVEENGALGAAMTAAVMAQEYGSLEVAVDKMVAIDETIQPNKELAKIYDEKYSRYRQVINSMEKTWDLF